MAERKIHNYESLILKEITISKEGFDPSLTGYQKKHIWAICRFCGQPSRILGSNFKKSGSACHKECRFKEQSLSGSPFTNPEIKAKAQANRTKNISQEELNRRISVGRLAAQSKVEQTCMEKYGVKNPFQSEEIKEKIKRTNLVKYGVEHPISSPIIQKRREDTNIATYGFSNPTKNIEVAKSISDGWRNRVQDNSDDYPIAFLLRSNQFWDAIKAGKSLSEIAKEHNLKYQSLASRLWLPEWKEKFRENYSYPKCQKQNQVVSRIEEAGHTGKIVLNSRQIISPMELDIFIPEANLAIEFNGSAWHSELFLESNIARNKHAKKTKVCAEKSIELFHVFEYLWDTRQEQICNLLLSKLKLNKEKIFARDCDISNDHCSDFIDNNHIQKNSPTNIKYFNLVKNNETIASMTASKYYGKKADNKVIVLNRLCFKYGISIIGGSARLFSKFVDWAKQNHYERIITWSDNTYTTGNIYHRLGFTLAQDLDLDYFYWDMNNNIYVSKMSQRKNIVQCPPNMTENEWAKERGFYRIWDCGKKRWEFNL